MNPNIELDRRAFLRSASAATVAHAMPSLLWAAPIRTGAKSSAGFQIAAATDRLRILTQAKLALHEEPRTITSEVSPKNPGSIHSYFSQADYFWPNPKNPTGPYVNRDGQSNPENFDGHRRVMIRLSLLVPQLTAAWLLTRDSRYSHAAVDHLRAWFVTPETRMDPNLEYSQGVVGVSTGRSYGIIDTLHLTEVARAASILAPVMQQADRDGVIGWFRDYLRWMNTSEKGVTERNAKNNHATCWALQASEFARLTGDTEIRVAIRTWYVDKLLTVQMATDGSFPEELARTKPYSYSIFNFDVAGCLAQSLTTDADHVTTLALSDGRGFCRATEWIFPFLADKSKWPYRKDVEHFDSWPVRSPSLLFAGLACGKAQYIDLWKRLSPDPTDREIIRNYPVRQPLLWV